MKGERNRKEQRESIASIAKIIVQLLMSLKDLSCWWTVAGNNRI